MQQSGACTGECGESMNAVLLAIVAYVLVQFAIGAWVSRRITSANDYILAGRRLGSGLVAFSVFATYFGAEAIVASGRRGLRAWVARCARRPFAYAAAIIIVGLLFANALWSRGLTTFADLFRQRYSPGVERLVVIVLLPGSIIWAAAQIRAFGQVMDANSGMGLKTAIVLAAVLVAAYSVIGGLLADAVTDVVQGVVVLAGLVILGAIVGRPCRRGSCRAWPQSSLIGLGFTILRTEYSEHSRKLRSPSAAPLLPLS